MSPHQAEAIEQNIVAPPEAESMTDQLVEDSESARRVGEYLKLIDAHGAKSREADTFIKQYPDDTALKAWVKVANEVAANSSAAARQSKPRPESATKGFLGFAIFLLFALAGIFFGVYYSWKLAGKTVELTQKSTALEVAEQEKAKLKTELAQSQSAEKAALASAKAASDKLALAYNKQEPGLGPRLASASIKDGKLVIPGTRFVAVTEMRTEKRTIDGKTFEVKVHDVKQEQRRDDFVYSPDEVQAFDANGKAIDVKELMARFKGGSVPVYIGSASDKRFLKGQDDAVILTLPKASKADR